MKSYDTSCNDQEKAHIATAANTFAGAPAAPAANVHWDAVTKARAYQCSGGTSYALMLAAHFETQFAEAITSSVLLARHVGKFPDSNLFIMMSLDSKDAKAKQDVENTKNAMVSKIRGKNAPGSHARISLLIPVWRVQLHCWLCMCITSCAVAFGHWFLFRVRICVCTDL